MLIENYLLSYKQFKFLLDEKNWKLNGNVTKIEIFIHSIYSFYLLYMFRFI